MLFKGSPPLQGPVRTDHGDQLGHFRHCFITIRARKAFVNVLVGFSCILAKNVMGLGLHLTLFTAFGWKVMQKGINTG